MKVSLTSHEGGSKYLFINKWLKCYGTKIFELHNNVYPLLLSHAFIVLRNIYSVLSVSYIFLKLV
jgi:hypothetical protein